jgi:putative transposase
MRLMGIAALGPKPRTSKPAPSHRIYPYLLRNVTIARANHVWAADIAYIPIGRGFLDLVAVIDWASCAALAWRLSNAMNVSFCLAALEEALAAAGVAISMDGRGRWMDNVFFERRWRSLKHEDVDLKGYADGFEARRGVASWIDFHNHKRPHRAFRPRAPMAVWREGAASQKAMDMMDDAGASPTCPQRQQRAKPLAA